MKLLWQNKFDGFDLVKTSPLYYKGIVEREEHALNCYFFDRGVGIKSVSFDTQDGQILTYSKDGKIKKKSSAEKHNLHDLSLDDFVFGEYTISHYGEWGYVCKKNEQLLWKKSLKGYLYTDIVLNQNNIVFGTSGQGGHFYSLNLDTGEIVFDFNTKGTSQFFDENNSYYFCSVNNKYTQILRIDYNGKILGNIEVEGVYHEGYCLFDICGDLLCVMTLKKKRKGNSELFSPIFHCVQL
ncbi:MAG: hypothetical protein IKM34_01660 [Clostridia bacterium]|nr:hypothetical protein [Clostridia bacterium]